METKEIGMSEEEDIKSDDVEVLNNEIVDSGSDIDGDSDVDDVLQILESDPDFIKLKEREAELMNLISDYNTMKSYKDARKGIGVRRQVSKKEFKKKKAKRRMVKKSKK